MLVLENGKVPIFRDIHYDLSNIFIEYSWRILYRHNILSYVDTIGICRNVMISFTNLGMQQTVWLRHHPSILYPIYECYRLFLLFFKFAFTSSTGFLAFTKVFLCALSLISLGASFECAALVNTIPRYHDRFNLRWGALES